MYRSSPSRTSALLIGLGLACSLPGCAGWLNSPHPQDARTDMTACSIGLSPSDNSRLAAIEQLIRDNKAYAALAQLDTLKSDEPIVKLTRADALRRIERTAEAQAIYQSLTNGCLDGRAQQGLGLLAAQQGRLSDSLKYLQRARQTMPTDWRLRNDLGEALLQSGRLDEARFELLTVLDLKDKEPRAARNLVLLTFKQGLPDKARELAQRLGMDTGTVAQLAMQAAPPVQVPAVPAPVTAPVTPPRTPPAPVPAASAP